MGNLRFDQNQCMQCPHHLRKEKDIVINDKNIVDLKNTKTAKPCAKPHKRHRLPYERSPVSVTGEISKRRRWPKPVTKPYKTSTVTEKKQKPKHSVGTTGDHSPVTAVTSVHKITKIGLRVTRFHAKNELNCPTVTKFWHTGVQKWVTSEQNAVTKCGDLHEKRTPVTKNTHIMPFFWPPVAKNRSPVTKNCSPVTRCHRRCTVTDVICSRRWPKSANFTEFSQ